MIEITIPQAGLLSENGKVGCFSEYGAIIGDNEFILVYEKDDIYLAHISEFVVKGIMVKLKKEKS